MNSFIFGSVIFLCELGADDDVVGGVGPLLIETTALLRPWLCCYRTCQYSGGLIKRNKNKSLVSMRGQEGPWHTPGTR